MVNLFVAREKELKNLNVMYQSNRFEMAVIYGRRRIGKTSLIKKFIEDKPAIYLQGIEATSETNLRFLSEVIFSYENPNRINKNRVFANFREAFEEIQDIADRQSEKLILVLDEYPYLAQSNRSISSILQYVIDHLFIEHANIMLILCGSSMSFMEHQVLGYQSPLYGRRTGQLKLLPFNIFDVSKMLPKVAKEDLLVYYGITGGVPQYLEFIDEKKTVQQNIESLFLNQNAVLQNEPNILLQQELRNPATYFSILEAIAHGKNKNSEIMQAIGFNGTNSISQYLKNLLELDIIERKQPIFENNRRKFIYAIKDSLFKFWFKFIAGKQDLIALERTQGLLEEIMHELPRFLGPTFEKASADWIWAQTELPLEPRTIKSWWGTNPILKRQEEVDLVAPNFDNSEIIIAECKWRNPDKLSHQIVDTLINRAALIGEFNSIYYYVFVKKSNEDFDEYATNRGVKVVEYQNFFK